MWNIMKALNYQVQKDNIIRYGFLFVLVITFVMLPATDGANSLDALTGSLVAVLVGNMSLITLMILIVIFATRISGHDYMDKTMNYEIMSGHLRSEVYLGRVIVSILWCLAGSFVLMALPIVVFSAVSGWGVSMEFKGALLRYLLIIFPVFRLTCEFILLTFLLKNANVAMVIGYVLFDVVVVISMILNELYEIELTVQFAATNMMELLNFSNYSLGYVNGEDVIVYSTALDGSLIVGTIVVSLTVGVVCLLLGYVIFKKSDL